MDAFHSIAELENLGINVSDIKKLAEAGFHTVEAVSRGPSCTVVLWCWRGVCWPCRLGPS